MSSHPQKLSESLGESERQLLPKLFVSCNCPRDLSVTGYGNMRVHESVCTLTCIGTRVTQDHDCVYDNEGLYVTLTGGA